MSGSQKYNFTGRIAAKPGHVTGAILAAGASSRFRTPKALALYEGTPLLERILLCLASAGCTAPVAVVGGPHAGLLGRKAVRVPQVPVPDQAPPSMLTSFLTALQYAREQKADFLVVALLDQPRVLPRTVAALVAALQREMASRPANGKRWAVPRYGGRCGHPIVGCVRTMSAQLRDAHDGLTLRTALSRCGERLEVDVDDPSVLDDLDGVDDAVRLGVVPYHPD